MPRATYGSQVKERAICLFRAIAAFAQQELDGVDQVQIKYTWQDDRTLIVRTTLRALEELCRKTGSALTKPQIREALNRMEDFLDILEDVRENSRGTEDWHFKLSLWSKDTDENVRQFDQAWEAKRPAKSKEQQAIQTETHSRIPKRDREESPGNQRRSISFGKPLQMPPLPDYFVERPEHQQAVKSILLQDDREAPATLVVSAIYGLGGIGKSVLAAWLAHNAEIQERFCDGVLWATLGQEPDILSFLCDWIQALGDRDFKPTTIPSASSHLQTLLYDKQVLLVVDDAWNPDHVEPFRVGRSGCRVLVTTRETSIAGAKRYDLEEMTADQSLELLTKKYPGTLIERESELAGQLAEEVGHLPLALELAAAQIEDGVSFSELLEDLQAETARLETLDRPVEVSAAYRKRFSLLASLNLSVQRLSPEQQRQFAWLGILPEDVLVSEQVAATLWEMTTRQAGAALRVLRSRALLLAGAQQVGQKPTYRIHDLMHALAKRLLTGSVVPESDRDLPGLGLELREAHREFLRRYRAKTVEGLWHTLPEDGHIHGQLTWHLEQAGDIEGIHALLKERTESGQNGWFVACEGLGLLGNFVTDVARAWKWADVQCETDPVGAIYWQCRYLLIFGSLNSMASNLPPELIAALVEKGVWKPIQGLAYVKQMPEAEQRAKGIGAIFSYLPEDLVEEALGMTRQIYDESPRASALIALVPHLPDLVDEALKVAHQIRIESERARALSALLPHLPDLIDEVLKITRQIQHEFDRADLLSALVPHLSDLADEALEAICQIQDEFFCADALNALVPNLPARLMNKALEVARKIQDEAALVSALSAFVPHFPKVLQEALEMTRQIQDNYFRALALSDLVPHLPEFADEALEIARQIEDNYSRTSVLSALVAHLPERLMGKALEIMRQIQDKSAQVNALSSLLPHLPELANEALEMTRQIQNEAERVIALRNLIPHLPEMIDEVLDVTRQIQDEAERAIALRNIVPYLPEIVDEALEVTHQIQNESSRVTVLRALVPYLPERLLNEALEATRQLQNEHFRAEVLSALALHLPEVVDEALEATRQLQSESFHAIALSALMPHLSEVVDEALGLTRLNEHFRTEMLGTLVPYSPEVVDEALKIMRQFQNEHFRTITLRALVPHLSERLPDKALEMTRQIQDESSRAKVLSALALRLSERLLSKALRSVEEIRDPYHKAIAFRGFARQLIHTSTTPQFWSETLHIFSTLKREESIDTLANLQSFLLVLGGTDALKAMVRALKEVCEEWR